MKTTSTRSAGGPTTRTPCCPTTSSRRGYHDPSSSRTTSTSHSTLLSSSISISSSGCRRFFRSCKKIKSRLEQIVAKIVLPAARIPIHLYYLAQILLLLEVNCLSMERCLLWFLALIPVPFLKYDVLDEVKNTKIKAYSKPLPNRD